MYSLETIKSVNDKAATKANELLEIVDNIKNLEYAKECLRKTVIYYGKVSCTDCGPAE